MIPYVGFAAWSDSKSCWEIWVYDDEWLPAAYDQWLERPYQEMMEEEDRFSDWAESEGFDLDDPAQASEAEHAYLTYCEEMAEVWYGDESDDLPDDLEPWWG